MSLAKFDMTSPKPKPVEEKMVEVRCSICTKRFMTPEWTLETGEPQVCSKKCAWEMGH